MRFKRPCISLRNAIGRPSSVLRHGSSRLAVHRQHFHNRAYVLDDTKSLSKIWRKTIAFSQRATSSRFYTLPKFISGALHRCIQNKNSILTALTKDYHHDLLPIIMDSYTRLQHGEPKFESLYAGTHDTTLKAGYSTMVTNTHNK